MTESKASEPTLPFIWPLPITGAESEHDDLRVPFEHVTTDASSIAGIVSDIDARGVAWLEELLRGTERKAFVILAVYAGCPTRFDHLSRLLELQSRETAKIEFRILPMTVGIGAPANCLAVTPKAASNPVFLCGATPNFGIAKHDPTQPNIAFRADPALTNAWCGWFDRTWTLATILTESTAKIPSLVPATGSAEAAAQWREYCTMCMKPEHEETQQEKTSTPLDQNPESSALSSKSDKTTHRAPSALMGLHELDRFTERVTRLLGDGKQVTVVHGSSVKPLDFPINPRFFDQHPEKRYGTVVQRQSFRISAFSEEEQKMIEMYRKASRRVISKLGLPFGIGLYWMPNKMISIYKEEISLIEKEAKSNLTKLVGPYSRTFIEGKRAQIKQDLERTYRQLGGQGDLPRDSLTAVLDGLELRIQEALESPIVAPVSFVGITFALREMDPHEAPWVQVEKLILALARFPRKTIYNSKIHSGLGTRQSLILEAMNIADDVILRLYRKSRRQAKQRSNWDLDQLDRITNSDISERDRCEAYFMIIDGKSSEKIQQFIEGKWSVHQKNQADSS